MAVVEVDALMKYKDETGNTTVLYPITKADNVDGLDEAILNQSVNTSGTGAAYTVNMPSITALSSGVSFIIIPHVSSTSTSPTLKVNDLDAIRIRRRLTTNTTTTSSGASDSWLTAGKPVRVTYDGTFWITDLPKPSATDLMGTVPIANGGTGASTATEALTNLGAAPAYTYGTTDLTAGTSSLETGKIYIVYE